MDFLKTLTPDLEQVSIDECFLDFTGIAHRYSSPEEGAAFIRASVKERFGFTVNVGISSSRVLAKMASDFEKPDKTHTLWPSQIPEKLWPLPIERLFMAGHSSASVLRKLEIRTIGDLANSDPDLITLHLKSHGRLLWEYANGLDETPVTSCPAKLKGVGNSVTLSSDVTDREEAGKILRSLAEKVAGRLRADQKFASAVCVEIKYSSFEKVSHQMQLNSPTQTSDVICRTAFSLFDSLWNGEPIRLLRSAPENSRIQALRCSFLFLIFRNPRPGNRKIWTKLWIRSGNVTEKMPFTGDFNKKELLSKQIISLS